MKSQSLVLLLNVSLLILAGCSQPSSSNEHAPQGFQGNLVEKMNEIYNEQQRDDRNYSPCDIDQKSIRLEIAQALEIRREKIESALQKRRTAPEAAAETNLYKLGSFQIVEEKTPQVGTDKWLSETLTWNQIIELYKSAQAQEINLDWLRLNSRVRGVIADDSDRIVGWVNYGYERLDGPKLLAIHAKVLQCLAIKCLDAKILPEEQVFLEKNEFTQYRAHHAFLTLGTPEYVEHLTKLEKHLAASSKRFAFQSLNHKTDRSTSTIVVHMNREKIGNDTSAFEKLTAAVWSSFGINVVIEWTPAVAFDLFSILTLDQGERAYVSRIDKTMNLPKAVSSKTISHEFGHVLGLRDEYYTSWKPEVCGYQTELNEGSIMSDHQLGKVLPSHIEKIKKAYFP